jgi:flagellar biosynthesis protein FlhG
MIISVVSAKGGVGKTTVVSNVSAALVKNFGRRVLVVDGNITTPTLGIHLGMLSQDKTLQDVLAGNINLTQAIYIHPCGLAHNSC